MSGRHMREIARQRKHGATVVELAQEFGMRRERVSAVCAGWAALRRETSPLRHDARHERVAS